MSIEEITLSLQSCHGPLGRRGGVCMHFLDARRLLLAFEAFDLSAWNLALAAHAQLRWRPSRP